MTAVNTVIFDFIGTLTNVRDYGMEDSKLKLCEALVSAGFKVDVQRFMDAYSRSHEKYRVIRYGKLVEVTNSVWVSEALNSLGFATTPEDSRVRLAVNAFFKDYVDSFELRQCAKQLLVNVSAEHRLGLISNFTYAPVIYAGLRKLGISRFFSAILVSEAVGWRKPHVRIFEEALKRLEAKPDETVYVGDSPLEDIKGAKALGMRTIFVPSQFYNLDFLHESQQEPDLVVSDVCELSKRLLQFMNSV